MYGRSGICDETQAILDQRVTEFPNWRSRDLHIGSGLIEHTDTLSPRVRNNFLFELDFSRADDDQTVDETAECPYQAWQVEVVNVHQSQPNEIATFQKRHYHDR